MENQLASEASSHNPATAANHHRFVPWIVWGLGAAFFFIEYVARVSPSVMINPLMRHFGVGSYPKFY